MRDNRERWQFFLNHPFKNALTPADVRYWKESLKKVLKVGMEFEFNLPEQKGTCKGDNIQCPCIYIEEKCWQGCMNTNTCKGIPCIDTCASRTKKCEPEDCKSCKNYTFKCIGISCVDFVSMCFTCDKFDKNCETCSKKYDPEKDPKQIRKMLLNEFNPSQHYGRINESGVVGITTDGSLLGDKGVEIITVGRRVDYWEFYTMSKRILEKVQSAGGYINERTGSHMHVLSSYYEDGPRGINEMEKLMPEIILSNFHQLCRRYQNALTWMTITLNDPNHMTRWEKFRVSILNFSPVTKDMRAVVEDISRHAGNMKYGFINYNRTRFKGKDVEAFHVEFREADSAMSPTYYAALACLHYALVIKAVEISRYGLLKVGDESWLKEAKKMKDVIMNGCGDWQESNRLSNTEGLLDHKEYFIRQSLDLVNQLKSILIKLGPAYDVLVKLAKRPLSLRRIDGNKWKEIEKDLAVQMGTADQLEVKISEVVDLRLIEDCKDVDEWITEVQKCITDSEEDQYEVSKNEIKDFVESKMREGEIIWSDSTGCMLAV